MKNFTLKKILFAFFCLVQTTLLGQSFTEGFDDISSLPSNGWVSSNTGATATGWIQGNPGQFDSYDGSTNAYASAGLTGLGTGAVSSWLLAPNRTHRNGDVFTFYTQKVSPDTRYDRLEVRISTNGASSNAGSSASTVGDFATLLLAINPTNITGVYPTSWTQYTITISGLSAPTSGRIGFRYYIPDSNVGGGYIGLDNIVYTPYVCPTITLSPSSGALTGGAAGSAYSTSLSQTGALGAPSFAITAGALPPGLTLSSAGTISGTPTATGTFNFSITAGDASGCSGFSSYSITVVCPANPVSISSLPPACSNDGPVELTQGSPAGGTYSGTGVTSDEFDPAAGTQTITYDYTDPYGCAFSTSATFVVNTAPTVTLDAFDDICEGSVALTLTGGSPAGGTYSGTNVSSGVFSPSTEGANSIDYTYTDANGCSGTASSSITVNPLPTVTASSPSAVCLNSDDVTLSFGSPAGGTYNGTNVSSGIFSPSIEGANSIDYTYTDVNGCSGTASSSITVNPLPTVTASSLSAVCENSGDITLSFGSPAGGTYSGTNVSSGIFSPLTSGTTTLTYSYTDGNGCEASATADIMVNVCTDVNDATSAAGIKCFPNPGTGLIVVEFEQQTESDVMVQISDLQGNVLASEEQRSLKGNFYKSFDLSKAARGIYSLQVRAGERIQYYKIVLQ